MTEFSFLDELFLQIIKSDSRDICYKIVGKKYKMMLQMTSFELYIY